MTRRTFLQLVSLTAGASGAYAAMHAMGMLLEDPASATAPSSTRPFKLTGSGADRRIIILGAGIAGLCAAYELSKIGYDCQILEARTRVGGRVRTIRGGDTETEIDGQSQACGFDAGEYFN